MATVDRPMSSSETTSMDVRPIRSPQWPNTTEPSGRDMNATANVEKAASVPASGSRAGKNAVLSTSAAAVP